MIWPSSLEDKSYVNDKFPIHLRSHLILSDVNPRRTGVGRGPTRRLVVLVDSYLRRSSLQGLLAAGATLARHLQERPVLVVPQTRKPFVLIIRKPMDSIYVRYTSSWESLGEVKGV